MDITKRQMAKIVRELNKFTIRTLREDGVGVSELDVLHTVRKNPGITQVRISQIIGLEKGAVARQTANLEAKGYLIRKENPADKRSQFLFATEKADSLKNSKAHIEALFFEWLLSGLEEKEQENFARLLEVLYLRCKAESRAEFPQMTEIVRKDGQNEK